MTPIPTFVVENPRVGVLEMPREAERLKRHQLRHHEELADGPRDAGDFCSPDVVDDTVWISGQRDGVQWIYIIDLDYRAFSVNGVHVKLDNMPCQPSFHQYFDEDEETELPIPEEYLTTVSYRPGPTFNVQEVSGTYDQLEPPAVDLEAWGAPSWDSLTVSQHLSVEPVKTIISDHKDTLAMADLMSEAGKVLLLGWQVACATAPSHVPCPTLLAFSSADSIASFVH
ncbi:hypothetical protein FRC06_004308 [Ceratobasidium sp. 370]|nr:hypothetical protein FRC06_004308 [Ceratobasidium sp. 370]